MDWRAFLDPLFPPRCLPCRAIVPRAANALCEACRGRINLESAFRCGSCRARLPFPKKTCHGNFPYLLGAATSYRDERVRALIHGLKFSRIADAAEPLGELLARYLAQFGPWPGHVLVPIPLSARRERERGFNQAQRIADATAKPLGLTVMPGLLVRAAHTPPQSELADYEARRKNVRGVFAVPDPERAKRARIILVDDVATSGATFFEAAKALKEAGTRGIVAAAVALA